MRYNLRLTPYSLCLILFLLPFISYSQSTGISINISGNPADNSAILDISALGKGILIPRMNSANRPANPIESLLIFNTDTKCFEAWDAVNNKWVGIWCLNCTSPDSPSAIPNTPSATSIIWNWNPVSGTTGYKWNTINDYSTATDNGANTSYTQTGLTCNTTYTLYIWAYNTCGNSSPTTLTQSTSACLVGCSGGATTMTDPRDSKIYNITQIGTQCWFAQNLNYGTYYAISPVYNAGYTDGYYPYPGKHCYNNDPSQCDKYGGYYTWKEAMNGTASLSCEGTGASQPQCSTPVQGICPAGWHIPSHYEWVLLLNTVGGTNNYRYADLTDFGYVPGMGGDECGLLTTGSWNGMIKAGHLFCSAPSATWVDQDNYSSYWTATHDFGSGNVAQFAYSYNIRQSGEADLYSYFDNYANSVRCVKD